MSTFVHEGVEVKKTGREAKRELRGGREMILVEIAPVDQAFDWKKWVDPNVLFVVLPD